MPGPTDIARIVAEGVLSGFNYDIPFNDGDSGRMRLIYAPNGRGKTNLLRGVSLALDPTLDSLQSLVEIPIKSLVIEFGSEASIAIERQEAFDGSYKATAKDSDGETVSIAVDPADFAGRLYRRAWSERLDYVRYVELVQSFSSGAVLIGDDRLAPAYEDPREANRADPYASSRRRAVGVVSRLLEKVERMLTQSALAGLSRENAATGVYAEITRTTLRGSRGLSASDARAALETQLAELIAAGAGAEKYGLLSLRQVRDIEKQLSLARANDRNLPTLHRILKPYLDSLADQIRSLDSAQELIDTFVTAVNSFLDRKKLLFSAGVGITLLGHDQTRLQPESLSSGERHLLFLLSHAILATESQALLVIDEPELSLGLEWQRSLLSALLRCSSSTNVQFLIASHSVQVMGELPGEIIQPTEASDH